MGKATRREVKMNLFKGTYQKTKTMDKDVELARVDTEVELARINLENNRVNLQREFIQANLQDRQLTLMESMLNQSSQSRVQSQFEPNLAFRTESRLGLARGRPNINAPPEYENLYSEVYNNGSHASSNAEK